MGGQERSGLVWLVLSKQLHGASPSQESSPLSASQIPVPDNTQHSQKTDIYDPAWVRTRNRGKWVAADTRLRPRGHASNNMFRENVEKKRQ